jgi:hypothetical protein
MTFCKASRELLPNVRSHNQLALTLGSDLHIFERESDYLCFR